MAHGRRSLTLHIFPYFSRQESGVGFFFICVFVFDTTAVCNSGYLSRDRRYKRLINTFEITLIKTQLCRQIIGTKEKGEGGSTCNLILPSSISLMNSASGGWNSFTIEAGYRYTKKKILSTDFSKV